MTVNSLPSKFLPAGLRRYSKLVLVALVLFILAAVLIASGVASSEPDPVGGPPMVRRLTEAQYRATIADIFGDDVPVTARFERPVRSNGLVAIGGGRAGMSAFAIEQYDAAAQAIASEVMGEKRRAKFLACAPQDEKAFDEKCAQSFIANYGRLLFRRPLSEQQQARYLDVARSAHRQLGGFHAGMELSLYTMLVSPDFLFRIEQAEPGAAGGTVADLDAYSKASRLSFFLTNSSPDDELLLAAENGDLDSSSGVSAQVERLMASPRFRGSIRDFFADMLQFDRFNDLSKDPAIYPAFNSEVAADAQEQTLRTIVEHLVDNNADYRELFTTRDTFLTRSLGVIYRTPVEPRDGWQAVTFADNANRAGIQSHISFLALHSHPGRSSPTLRGYAAREIFLCQHVPDPPPDVSFTIVEENAHTAMVTARDRLKVHNEEPSCAGCHKVMDPLGLTMENFDGVGGFRTHENGARINTDGDLDGTDFDTIGGLANALAKHPEAPKCVAERLYNSAVGRGITWSERYYLDWLISGFEDDGYRVPDLMRRIALSENFFKVIVPKQENRTDLVKRKSETGEKI